jgi:type IV pilus assembly protein PilC
MKRAEATLLMRQLANLLPAGVPIIRCIEMLEKTQQTASAKQSLYKIKQQLLSGRSLHESLALAPQWFDTLTCRLIHLGEQSGKLDELLLSLADYHEKMLTLRRRIKHALFYPAIIFITAILLTLCLFIFVIPSFIALYQESQPNLPWLTRMIFYLTSRLNQSLPWFFGLLIVVLGSIGHLARQGKLQAYVQHTAHYLPPIANALQQLAYIRIIRNLGIALQAGLPLLDALYHCAGVAGHAQLEISLRQLRLNMNSGISLHRAMAQLNVFPPLITQMVKVGEESGRLEALLLKTADMLEADYDNQITTLTQLLEPLIMTVLGVLIGGLVIGMYLPIFNLGSTL